MERYTTVTKLPRGVSIVSHCILREASWELSAPIGSLKGMLRCCDKLCASSGNTRGEVHVASHVVYHRVFHDTFHGVSRRTYMCIHGRPTGCHGTSHGTCGATSHEDRHGTSRGNMYFHGASRPNPWEISWDVLPVDPYNMAMPWVGYHGRATT